MRSERQLVEFIEDVQIGAIDGAAVTVARRVLAGTLATAVAGAAEEAIAPLRQLLVARGGTQKATSFVFGDRLPTPSAALLNATMARALDYCDAMAPGIHVGSSVVPAALAMAEREGGITGSELLRAVVIGCEVAARFNLTEEMYDGLDPTGIAGVFGATAAAAAVARLDGNRLLHALGHALNRCGGSYQSNVDASLAVRLQQGIVAQAAIECVEYAAAGITGPVNFLEGVYGYTHLYARRRCSPSDFVDELGHSWRSTGFMFKKYPSCGATQGVTQLTLEIVQDLDLRPDDVRTIAVALPPYCHRLVGNAFAVGPNPRVSAQFSVQYCVANAVVRRRAGLRDFEPAAVADPKVAALVDRIRVDSDPALDARGHSAVDIEVVTYDGRRARRGYDISPGYPGNDLTASDHRRRFDDCIAFARLPLAPGAPAEILTCVDAIEVEPDATRLLALVRSPAAT